MTSKGFKISGQREIIKADSKAKRKKKLNESILSLDPPQITKKLIMNKFGLTGSQAYLALKELTDTNKLTKFGRGENSIWKRTQVTV
jgi:hypothetical protein